MEALGIEISWPSRKPREKPARVHNHHVSLRDKIKELTHLNHHAPKAAAEGGGDKETTSKAVAWAVLQHHGEGVGHHQAHGAAVRRPTRFKIEAQMRHELAHRSVVAEAAVAKWDAGSTLFDSFELHSLLRTLDDAAHTQATAASPQKSHGENAGTMVVFTPPKSPTHATPRHDETRPSKPHGEPQQRYNLTLNPKQAEGATSVFGPFHSRKSFDSHEKRSFHSRKSFDNHEKRDSHHHHHSKWKSLLHTLHLDGAQGLFHHKSHTQVAPHDLEQRTKLRHNKHGGHSQELYDGHFERNEMPVSKDVDPPNEKHDDHHHDHHHHHHHHHHHPIFWKLKTGLFCRAGHATLSSDSDSEDPHREAKHHGHRQSELRKAWSSLTSNLLHHHHHHHHHDSPLVIEHPHHHPVHHEDDERPISRRSSRDEKVRRVSSEEGGLKTPRNSLESVVMSVSVHN